MTATEPLFILLIVFSVLGVLLIVGMVIMAIAICARMTPTEKHWMERGE